MCGICGIFTVDQSAGNPEYEHAVTKMTNTLARRGPDDEGYWLDPDGHLRLGFRRLSVMDPSSAGKQPMVSKDGRSVLVFNGEIYNFRELRKELEGKGVQFRSRSDTEVLLEALNIWGEKAIPRLNGMFAFAWYNIPERRLVLARDHAGVKPLYYYVNPKGGGVAFASRYDTLFQTPWGMPGSLRLDVLRLYLKLHHIPSPYCLHDNVFQLGPGEYVVIDSSCNVKLNTWWQLPQNPAPDLTGEVAKEALADAIGNAVRRQCVADVPLGVYLSGGVDSPLVTALARKEIGAGLRAFTISNPGWSQDEGQAAARYAAEIGVDHRVNAANRIDLPSLLDDISFSQYEPFADFSIIPTLLVSQFARKEVTVALSGDGGDELFFGYERPLSLLRNGQDFKYPKLIRKGLYGAGKYGLGNRRSGAIVFNDPGDYYYNVNCRISDVDLKRITPELTELPTNFDLYGFHGDGSQLSLANYSRYVEYYGQLQRCLKKVDMASMHYCLEVRVPLLDREVIETSLRIDPFESMRNGERKTVLRELLTDYIPENIIPKPKRGFSVPLGAWFQKELKSTVQDTLLSTDLYPAGIIDRSELESYCNAHFSGERDLKWGIWTLLSLQWWGKRMKELA